MLRRRLRQPFVYRGLVAGEKVKPLRHEFFVRFGAALLIASLAAPGFVQGADYRIGFVNGERLFREAAPAKRAQQKIEKEFAARDAEIQKLSKQLRDMQALLDKDGVTMAEPERRSKERDLASLSRELQRMHREF